MTKRIYIKYIIILAAFIQASVKANVGVPLPNDHVKRVKNIVVGTIVLDDNKRVYLEVSNSLKGDLVKGSKILIDSTSMIAWSLQAGGLMVGSESENDFREVIGRKRYFGKKVILLGEFRNGHWKSDCYDWSIWPHHGGDGIRDKPIAEVTKKIEEYLKNEK